MRLPRLAASLCFHASGALIACLEAGPGAGPTLLWLNFTEVTQHKQHLQSQHPHLIKSTHSILSTPSPSPINNRSYPINFLILLPLPPPPSPFCPMASLLPQPYAPGAVPRGLVETASVTITTPAPPAAKVLHTHPHPPPPSTVTTISPSSHPLPPFPPFTSPPALNPPHCYPRPSLLRARSRTPPVCVNLPCTRGSIEPSAATR